MNRVWVADMAVQTALGDGLNGLWDGLMHGRTAIAPVKRFSTQGYHSSLAACIEGLEGAPKSSMIQALTDQIFKEFGEIPKDCRLLTASTKGAIDDLERMRRGQESACGNTLISTVLNHLVEKLELQGSATNINAACASSTIAIARASAMIASGMAEAVLVCCMDLVSEFVFSGFSALQALSSEPSRPFDKERTGLSLGEGGAALLLMSENRARREGRRHLGTVLGWGVANDANHVTAPAKDGCGLIQAVRQAIDCGGLSAGDIAAVNAHGTGTVFNDLMELTAFKAVFAERKLPIHSVKGAIGHTLGAAGGIEVALGLRSLAEGVIPPTVGFENPEDMAKEQVSANAQSVSGDVLLSTNSGFGGINGALILGKGEDL